MKRFYIQTNIGTAKYVVNHYDGSAKNPDGSNFWGITIFKNKRKMDKYVRGLLGAGYSEGKE